MGLGPVRNGLPAANGKEHPVVREAVTIIGSGLHGSPAARYRLSDVRIRHHQRILTRL